MAANISLDSEVLFINFVRACMAGAIMAATSLSPIRCASFWSDSANLKLIDKN